MNGIVIVERNTIYEFKCLNKLESSYVYLMKA